MGGAYPDAQRVRTRRLGSAQCKSEWAFDQLDYRAKFAFNGVTAKAPKLKAPPQMDGFVSVITNQIDAIQMTLKAPGNDLKIQGKLVSFSNPHLDLSVTSREWIWMNG